MIRGKALARAVRRSYFSAKSTVAGQVRGDSRTIIWTPEAGLGAGNQMYLWLNAFTRQKSGEDCRVLSAPGAEDWLLSFPKLRGVVINRRSVSFRDAREGVDDLWLRQRTGVDFTLSELDDFLGECILPELGPSHDMTVINVRRGDFYGTYREKYGFDIAGYLAEALPQSLGRVLVVSDDPAWCRVHLRETLARAREVDFAAPGATAQFELLAGAKELFLTNSTFGYWGGYVATTRGGSVTAPWLHARGVNGNVAYQLLPSWTVIGPGPWDTVPSA